MVYVDGEKAESTLVADAMVAVYLTEGEHIVEFRYENRSFTQGLLLSLLGAAILLALCLYPKIRKRKEVS